MKHNAKLTEIKRCFKSRTLKKMYLLNGNISYNSQTRFILLKNCIYSVKLCGVLPLLQKENIKNEDKDKKSFLRHVGGEEREEPSLQVLYYSVTLQYLM